MPSVDLITLVELPAACYDLDHSWRRRSDRTRKEIDDIAALETAFTQCVRVQVRPQLVFASCMESAHWEAIVRHHLAGIDPPDSCALFGGYGLQVNEAWRLLPQCCGTLADIENWQDVARLTSESNNGVWIGEGHPAPLIHRHGLDAVVDCLAAGEPFFPPINEPVFRVRFEVLCTAVQRALEEAQEIEAVLDRLAPGFGVTSLRHILYQRS